MLEVDPEVPAESGLAEEHLCATRIRASQVPLSAFSHFEHSSAPLAINHQGQFPVVTHFLQPGAGVFAGRRHPGDRAGAKREIGLPPSIHASFQGTAAAFQNSLSSEPWLILAAVIAVYIVLGVLYESYIHPITILSTLPSAGVGAILALLLIAQRSRTSSR